MPGTAGCSARYLPTRRARALARACGATAAMAMTLCAPSPAAADPNGGIVTGTVVLASAEQRGATPVHNQGFVRRVPALRPPRALDPRPQMIVVLEGATPPEEDRQPPDQPARYAILGESFETPLVAVVVGSVVSIHNAGRGAPRIYSPDQADLVPADPISPGGERKTRKIEPAHRTFELRDRESVHLSGRIVALPHRYFSLIAGDGHFAIQGVAPGTWKVRVWYRDGWADVPEETVEVVAKKESKPIKIALPAKFVTRPAR
ncbi:MAG TPA: hypothetical protein VKB80_29140 [Kofleriaceae bacterium]|nr:hypothetical protein [Kofleriaceae bacterium]